jgi:hypothetical protein
MRLWNPFGRRNSSPAVSHPNHFWVGENVFPLLAGDRRQGQVKRLIDAETVEVDWFSGNWSGLKTEKECDLRLDHTSPSNRNPYRIGDLVKSGGERYKVTGIWDRDVVRTEKVSDGSGTHEFHVIYLSPCGTTEDNIKLRAARRDRAAVTSSPLAACPQCNAGNERCTLMLLLELKQGKSRPIAMLCEECQQLSPFADWLRHSGVS